jgi:L-fuculose-phosphate aldolase
MATSGLTVAKEGNVSARVDAEQLIVITPHGIPYESMRIEDLLAVDFSEHVVDGNLTPSLETKLHLAIYRARQDVGAVVHTHSTYATALSALAEPIPPFLEEQIPHLGGEIKTARYGRSGTDELGRNVVDGLGDRHAVLVASHGVVCCGKDLDLALSYAQRVERIAQIYLLARNAGKIKQLPRKTIEDQKKIYKRSR